MAIEGLIAQKSRVLEDLLRLTAKMTDHLLKNDHEGFESALEARSQAYRALDRIDKALTGQAVSMDDLWLKQLKMIEGKDSEMIGLLKLHRRAIDREQSQNGQELQNLLQETMLDPKGQKIETTG